jgi:hypothetical protein
LAKQLFDIVSIQRLRQKGENPGATDALGLLAKSVVEVFDARGTADAEATFLDRMPDYFHNLRPMSKRRYADALAVAFCQKEDFDEFWEYLKKTGVTGRTIVRS